MKNSIRILLLVICVMTLLTSCRGFEEDQYDWTEDVQNYLDMHYRNIELDSIPAFARTTDERNIEFTIDYHFGYKTSWFVTTRTKYISDNFKERINEWFEESRGVIYNIEGKTSAEIADEITSALIELSSVYQEYGIQTEPRITFILWDSMGVYKLVNPRGTTGKLAEEIKSLINR